MQPPSIPIRIIAEANDVATPKTFLVMVNRGLDCFSIMVFLWFNCEKKIKKTCLRKISERIAPYGVCDLILIRIDHLGYSNSNPRFA